MSCRTTPYGSAYTTLARLNSGLSDVQTLSLYHALRRENSTDQVEATWEAWSAHLDETRDRVEADTNLSDARRRSILARLEASRENLPDNASFRAIRLLENRATAQNNALNAAIVDIAQETGWDEDDVRTRFNAAADEVDHARNAARPATYTDDNVNTFRRRGLPIDRGTVAGLSAVRAAAAEHVAAQQAVTPQRITRQPMNSSAVAEAGYDPRGGRLEVVMNSNPDRVYMYRNVPSDVWDRMQSGSAGRVFATTVRGNGLYQYRTREEAEAAGLASRCSNCGQFSQAGHQCPVTAAPEIDLARHTESLTFGGDVLGDAFEDVTPDVDVEAEAAGTAEPEPTPAPEPEPTPEPEPRPQVRLYRSYRARQRFSQVAIAQYPTAHRGDVLRIPSVTDIRSVAQENEVTFPMQWAGSRYSYQRGQDGQFQQNGYFNVQGEVAVRRDGRDWNITTRDLRCNCAEYQVNYECEHTRAAINGLRAAIVPARSANAASVDPEAAQRAAEEAARTDWTRQEELMAEARQSWANQGEDENYSTNFQSFENDIKAAEERVAAGESPIVYQRENALDGWCPEGGNEGFGVELEFVLPQQGKSAALQAIATDLYNEGLGYSDHQMRYHSTSHMVFQEHARGWKFEQDCTVDGEIISPVMRDTPETWANIEKVCEIVKRHGGKASAKTGSHVHVSAPNMTGAQAANLLHTVNQHEDVIYRLSSNPEASKHRNMTWCGPNREIADGTTDLHTVQRAAYGHNSGLNLQHVSGSGGDHPEMRHWDGTLDPSVIQAQVKMSVGLVKAAERNQTVPATRRKEPVGSHYKRLKAVVGGSRRKLTSEELREDSATVRSFADTLFKRPEDKAQVAALFSVTKWMN